MKYSNIILLHGDSVVQFREKPSVSPPHSPPRLQRQNGPPPRLPATTGRASPSLARFPAPPVPHGHSKTVVIPKPSELLRVNSWDWHPKARRGGHRPRHRRQFP